MNINPDDAFAAVGSFVPPDPAEATVRASMRTPRDWASAGGVLLLVALGGVGGLIPSGSDDVPAVWLPAAIALAVALIAPSHRRPVLCIGSAFGAGAAAIWLVGDLPSAALAGATTGFGALAASWVLRDLLGRPAELRSWVDVSALTAVGVVVVPALTASTRAPVLSRPWWAWVIAEGVAVIILTPLALASRAAAPIDIMRQAVPAAVLGAAVALAVYGIASSPGTPGTMPFLGAPMLVMIGVALRWGVRGLVACTFGSAAIAIPATAAGLGPFALAGWDATERIASVEIFIGVMGVALLGLAIGFGAQRDAFTKASHGAASFEALAASAPVGIVVLDPDGDCTSVNARFTQITGVSEGDARGDGWLTMVHPDDREQVRRRWLEALATHTGIDERVRLLGPQGVVRWVSVVFEVRRSHGKVTGSVGVLTDVTGDVEAEDMKASFLSRTSHELRTPLTIILGLTQTMSRPDLAPEQRQDMERRVMERAQHLNGLIDRLLIASGKADEVSRPAPVAVDLADLLEARVEPLRANGLDVTVDVPAATPAALAPRDALEAVVDELLDNAQKFSPGGTAFAVDARARDGVVVIGVTDWGIGMDDEQQRRCFEQFWQGEDKDTRRFEGTGIGLFVVKTLVESWGGTVHAQSVLGSGSRFEFTVPQVPPKRRAAPRRASA